MRKNLFLLGLSLLSAAGCSNMNNTEKDGLMGAGAGAAAGALLTRGNPVGAVIGGLFGGLVGSSIGNTQDHVDARNNYVNAVVANQARNQMTLSEVVQLSQQNTPTDIIIRQISSSGSVFALRAEDITYLRQQGVNDQVIGFMQTRYGQPVYVQGGPPVVVAPPPGVVVVGDPYGPPPVAVGVGVGFGGRYR